MSIELKIFIGCYATYNDGYLFDKQYTVSDSNDLSDAWKKAEKNILKQARAANPKWKKEGYLHDDYCEELYIADYELYIDGEFIKCELSEHYGCAEDLLDALNESYNYPIELLLAVNDSQGGDLSELKELDDNLFIFEVDSKSHSDLSYGFLEKSGGLDQYDGCDFLKRYFDHESHGYDLSMDFTVYDINNTYYAVSSN